MMASLASVELAINQNGVACNAIVVALASLVANDYNGANENIGKALESLKAARESAKKIGIYANEAFS